VGARPLALLRVDERGVRMDKGSKKIRNLILSVAGFLCLVLGAVGVVMPLVPTTPFVLLAAVCFSSSNKRVAAWLQKLPFFGAYIGNFRTKQGVSKKLKAVSILLVWLSLLTSMIMLQTPFTYVLLSIVGICVSIHLLMLKTKKQPTQNTRETGNTREVRGAVDETLDVKNTLGGFF